MKYLYKQLGRSMDIESNEILNVEIVTPKIWGRKILQGENKSFKLLAVRCLFQLITFGKAKIYSYRYNGELVHTSYVIPKCYKFPFMSKWDYEIGPCFTHPKYRGKGIYPQMLKYICSSIGTKKTVFYMIVDETNLSSIKGIEKAGFQRCGTIKVTRILKRYQLE